MRAKHQLVASHTLRLGVKPETFWCTGQRTNRATRRGLQVAFRLRFEGTVPDIRSALVWRAGKGTNRKGRSPKQGRSQNRVCCHPLTAKLGKGVDWGWKLDRAALLGAQTLSCCTRLPPAGCRWPCQLGRSITPIPSPNVKGLQSIAWGFSGDLTVCGGQAMTILV